MPRRRILSDDQIADLEVVLGYSRKDLEAVLKTLKSAKQPPLSQLALHRLINEAIPPAREAETSSKVVAAGGSMALTRLILGIGGGLYTRENDILEERLDELTADLRGEWGADKTKIERWNKFRPLFSEILRIDCVGITIKSIDISYEYENVFQYSRIMTDVRPVFNDDGDEIHGAIVSFTLRMNYLNAGESRSLSIALDAVDLQILSYHCERALVKAETAMQRLSSNSGAIPSTILGKDDAS